MSASASSRFVVEVKGVPRVLLSVREQLSGRLIITAQGAGNKRRDLGIPGQERGVSDRHNVRIAHQKFSVHPSLESSAHNQLHFHQISADGKKDDGYHVTRAITARRFAALFVKRYSALKDPSYDLKKGSNVTTLGKYDVTNFSLILCVLIAHRDCVFTEKSYDISCIQPQFQLFRLIILWSFFLLPATDFSMISGNVTFRPEEANNEEEKKFFERLMTGYDGREAMQYFSAVRDIQRDEGIETAMKFVPEFYKENPRIVDLARFRYFRNGERTNKVIKAVKARFPGGI